MALRKTCYCTLCKGQKQFSATTVKRHVQRDRDARKLGIASKTSTKASGSAGSARLSVSSHSDYHGDPAQPDQQQAQALQELLEQFQVQQTPQASLSRSSQLEDHTGSPEGANSNEPTLTVKLVCVQTKS